MRKGCVGCLGLTGGSVALLLLVWLFAPGLLDRAIDWALYVEPPEVQVAPNGQRQVKNAFTELYGAVVGDRPIDRVVLSEGAINGMLAPTNGGTIQDARADLEEGRMTLYAAIDLEKASGGDYADLLAEVPSFLRDRRVSVRVELSDITTEGDRLNFKNWDVKIGRVWLPVSEEWVLPLLQRMAERKLGTRVPEKGLPLPPNSKASIANGKLVIDTSGSPR